MAEDPIDPAAPALIITRANDTAGVTSAADGSIYAVSTNIGSGVIAPPAPSPAQGLDAWFDQHIRNSVFSQSTETCNRIHRAIGEIKAALNSVAPSN